MSLKKWLLFSTLSCRRAEELIAKKEVAKLTLKERFSLWYHKKKCKKCRLYQRQYTIICRAIKNFYVKNGCSYKLSEQRKNQIIQKLKEMDLSPEK
jgi:hypothetical protein